MNSTQFLDSFFEQIRKVGLDVVGLPLDHIAYQASSAEDYEKLFSEFSELGDLASQEMIGGRRVAVFALKEPITYMSYHINVLELIEPRDGQVCDSDFQHAEFVVDSFEEFLKKYPELPWDTSSMDRDEFAHLKLHFENGLTVKFLLEPILEQMQKNK